MDRFNSILLFVSMFVGGGGGNVRQKRVGGTLSVWGYGMWDVGSGKWICAVVNGYGMWGDEMRTHLLIHVSGSIWRWREKWCGGRKAVVGYESKKRLRL